MPDLLKLLANKKLPVARFAKEVGLLRGHIYEISKGIKVPRGDTADAIIKGLAKHGIELSLAELLAPSRKLKRSKAA